MGNTLLQVPLPLKGLNTVNPHVSWDSGYAREFTNYSLYNGRPYMRPAFRTATSNFNPGGGTTIWFDVTSVGGSEYIIQTDGEIYKLSDGTNPADLGGSVSYNPTEVKHLTLDYVIGLRAPRIKTYPFTAWSFTTISITATDIRSACSHKGHLYVSDASTIEYSELQATGGAMAGSFPLNSGPAGLLGGQSILRMFSVTVNPSVSTENVLVIFGDAGKVIVYAGDYPGSANWQIIGKYDMPIPISNLGFLEKDGDIFVATREYAYWFRDLFVGGSQTAYLNSPTRPIENLWQSNQWQSTLGFASHVFFEPRLDAIIVNYNIGTSTYTDIYNLLELSRYWVVSGAQSSRVSFVYFRKYNAWAVWFSSDYKAPVLASSTLTSATLYTLSVYDAYPIKKIVHGNSEDQAYTTGGGAEAKTISIETSWKTPYYYGKVGTKLNGIRVFFENTISGYLDKVRAIFDYSDYNRTLGWYHQSNSQTAVVNPGNYADGAADITANTWNQYNPFIGVGGQGGSVSLQFTLKAKSGSSTTQTQNIYAATAHIEPAGELF